MFSIITYITRESDSIEVGIIFHLENKCVMSALLGAKWKVFGDAEVRIRSSVVAFSPVILKEAHVSMK